MVDIHCHLVPGVDDGAESVETALAMIEEAKRCGITAILTTPHIKGRLTDLALHEEHKRCFAKVLQQKPDLPLFLGCEVRVTPETQDIVSRKEFTSAEAGRYILLELDFDKVPTYLNQLLFEFRLNGIRPIIAHPERNAAVLRNPEHALEFVRHGALLQVTTGAMLGELGEPFEECALALIESGLVDILASDAHNVTTRRFTNWPATYDLLQRMEQKSQDYIRPVIADDLATRNPMAVCSGGFIEPLELDEPTMVEIRKRLSGSKSKPPVKRKRMFFM